MNRREHIVDLIAKLEERRSAEIDGHNCKMNNYSNQISDLQSALMDCDNEPVNLLAVDGPPDHAFWSPEDPRWGKP